MKVEGLISETNNIRSQIAAIDANEDLLRAVESAAAVGSGEPTVMNEPAKSLGDAFTKSEGYKRLKARGLAGNWTSGPVEITSEALGMKLDDGGSPATTVVSITGAGGTLPLNPQVAPMVTPVEEPLTIASLFAQGTATQNSIVYLEETTTRTLLGHQPYSGQSSLAKTTAEGAAKPAVFVDFTKKSTSIEKIAAFLPISDEMLEDEPQIASYINGRLTVFVRQAEEAYLMNKLLGSGIATADASDLLGAGATNTFDAIAAGILTVQTGAGMEPDAVVVHPVDFWKMATSKDAVNGQYFSGGPYAAPARNPWGVRVVVTREAMLGFPLVGAFRDAATLWRKGGLSVEASNSHADYFRKNLTAIRAEERLGLTVLRPQAFVKVNI
jgi:HK97 family phage major capsid protein